VEYYIVEAVRLFVLTRLVNSFTKDKDDPQGEDTLRHPNNSSKA